MDKKKLFFIADAVEHCKSYFPKSLISYRDCGIFLYISVEFPRKIKRGTREYKQAQKTLREGWSFGICNHPPAPYLLEFRVPYASIVLAEELKKDLSSEKGSIKIDGDTVIVTHSDELTPENEERYTGWGNAHGAWKQTIEYNPTKCLFDYISYITVGC